jgi:hypothetical protein
MQHPFEHDITALAYDLVEGAERESLLEHLAECDACRALYDSFRDEQLAVRDAIVSDARSGAAEAKALESTLAMIGTMGETEKRGRIIRMPLWLLAAEVAAMLVVAIGLIFLLKPDEPVETVVPVAEVDRAPATIESGVAYVQTPVGEWKPAEAVPVDQWVKAGPEKFALQLAGGTRAELAPDSVFRISFENGQDVPIVYMLRGEGVIDSANVSYDALVRGGDASFYTMPGARLQLNCEAENQPLRSWSAPLAVRARVLTGDVFLASQALPQGRLPLRAGETFEWKPSDMSLTAEGETIYFDFATLFAGEVEGDDAQLNVLLKRIEDGRDRNQKYSMQRLVVGELDGDQQYVILIVDDTTLTVSTDGTTLSAVVKAPTANSSYEAKSVEALRAAVPARIAEILDGIEIAQENGRYVLKGGHAEGQNKAHAQTHSKSTK